MPVFDYEAISLNSDEFNAHSTVSFTSGFHLNYLIFSVPLFLESNTPLVIVILLVAV